MPLGTQTPSPQHHVLQFAADAIAARLQEDDGEYVETHQQATCGNWSNRSLLDNLPTFNRVLRRQLFGET